MLGICTLFLLLGAQARGNMHFEFRRRAYEATIDSCGSGRAYSGWRGESVTRGDRRRRELEVRKLVSAARPPARIDGAMDVLGSFTSGTVLHSLRPTEEDSWFANYKKFLLCFTHDRELHG